VPDSTSSASAAQEPRKLNPDPTFQRRDEADSNPPVSPFFKGGMLIEIRNPSLKNFEKEAQGEIYSTNS
jgi:hypothetical protein